MESTLDLITQYIERTIDIARRDPSDSWIDTEIFGIRKELQDRLAKIDKIIIRDKDDLCTTFE